jgi:PAS domain S-box-containing protein
VPRQKRRFFAPPTFEDEEKTRVAGLLNTVLLGAMATAVLYGILAPILYENALPLLATAGSVIPAWFGALLLLRRGRVQQAGMLFLVVLWLAVTAMVIVYGGLGGSAVVTYLVVIFAAGLLLGTRAGLFFSTLSLIAVTGVLWAEISGILPDELAELTPTMIWGGLVTNLILAALLVRLAAGNINRALSRARSQERALAASNRELEAEIAERIRIESALRDSEERYRTILDSIEDGYFEVDLAGSLTFFNDALCRIIGYAPSELLGMNNRHYMNPENAHRVYQVFNQVFRTGEPMKGFDWELRRPDGTWRYVEASVSLIRDASGEPAGFRGIARDVTERKQRERVLRENEEWLRAIVEGTHALLFQVDTGGRLTYANDAAARTMGRSAEALVGMAYLEFVHPEERDKVRRAFAEEVNSEPVSRSLEFRLLAADGGVTWVRVAANPLFEDGEVVGHMAVAVDIGDRVAAEERLRRFARELQVRNEELDAFAHTVAHDLQDPLSLVVGFADVLQADYHALPAEEVARHLSIIADSGLKMSKIIENLLLLARVRRMEVEVTSLDMSIILAEAQARLAHLIEERGAKIEMPAAFPAVQGYGPWVEEVWVNYLSNAIKYGGCPPCMEIGAQPVGVGMIRFWIRDNGCGISPEEQARLFVPFTRLNASREPGHGLGLSIVQRIVERLGGEAGAESPGPGQGSTFYFTLPEA